MRTSFQLDQLLTEFRQELENLYGDRLVDLVLYGSQARGDATENSDIDIMVILKSPISPGDEIFRMGNIMNKLNLKYDQLVSIMPMSEENFLCQKTPFLENVREEGIRV
jgi:uncharacterized protein